jgi:hypothetical protein
MADFTVSSDLDTFMQSADKPAMRTNMDLGTAATKDVAATGDAAAGEVVKGDDTRLTDARTPTSHTHTASEVTDFDTEVANNSTVAANTSKLAGIEAGAEVNNISDTNATDLTDGGDSTLHYHSADRSRANHTGTQTLSTISDAGTAATKDVPAAGDAAAGEVVLGNDSRLTDARTPTAHTHTAAEITDFDTEVSNNTDVAANTSKLSGIEAGAEVNNISDTNATDLTDGGDSTLHYHSADRNRANHTGTQTLSTISDAGTIASQNANSVTITGGSVTGITDLAVADGGTGASTAAAARTNLEVYSDAEVDAKVATKAVAGGVELDGTTTTYFEIPTTSIGNIFTSEGSFSFYAKLKDLSLNHTIFDCRNSSAVGGFGIFYRNDGKIRLLHETSGTVLIGEAELIINENEWFHCVITHDGTVDSSAPIFFLNGVQLVTSAFTTASGTIGTVPPSVGRFGEVVTGGSAPLLGSIKNALFFNRALSASEVADLYESGTVAVEDRWGETTPKYTSDFSTDADSWQWVGSGSGNTVTGNTDSVGGEDDTLEVDFSGSGRFAIRRGGSIGLQVGDLVRLKFSAYFASGSNAINKYFQIGSGFAATNLASTSPQIVNADSWEEYEFTFTCSDASNSDQIKITDTSADALGTTGSAFIAYFKDIQFERIGCIADLPLDEGIGYQFHDRSSNHFDALASTSGVTHLVPKTEGKVRVKAADASSATYMLRTDSILPTDSIITEVLSEQCYVDLINSAQVLDDYRIRLNPSGSDLQIQRSDGSNHATLGTVTAPSSLSDVDVQIHYEQVAR